MEKLNAAINAALSDPKVMKKSAEMGSDATPQTPAQFGDLIRDDTARWSEVVKKANITSD